MKKSKRLTRALLLLLAGGVFSCMVLAGAAYLSNQNLPTGPAFTDRLDPLDKTRLAETLHLKAELGESVWPGWGDMEIPVLLWNRHNNFLIGISQAPADWEEVPGDDFQGEAYYRNPGFDPQNFAMLIGDEWAASIATKHETDLFIQDVFRGMAPSPLDQIIPYRLLIRPSEVQISAALHESFHVYQVWVSPASFEATEKIYPNGDRYWETDQGMGDSWKTEINLLIQALNASSKADAAILVGRFLDQRSQRRETFALDAALIDYERRFEWLEGLAKYVELAVWEQAWLSSGYQPIPELSDDPDFEGYATFERHWRREIGQARTQARQEGDTRFYYTGMIQARLLDRLMPDWKSRIMGEDVFLEDLLRQTLSP